MRVIEMSDTEKLIAAIGQRECLWNPNCMGYMNRELKERSWEEVVDEVWSGRSNLGKTDKILELKKKWSNVRDYYKRLFHEARNRKKYDDAKRKKYIYSDMLTFLDPILEKSKCPSEHEGSLSKEDTEEEVQEIIKKEVDYEDDYDIILGGVEDENCSVEQNEKKWTDPNPTASNSWPERREKISNNSNISFLMSFVQEMEEMTPYQRIDFKCGMMDLLRKVKYPYPPPN